MRSSPLFVQAILLLAIGISAIIPPQQCGQRKILHTQLINGGQNASPGRWPWHAVISHFINRRWMVVCGGSIINHNTILTAAHCVNRQQTKRVRVQVGKTLMNDVEASAKTYTPAEFVVHPEHRDSQVENDIALIVLREQIVMSDYIQPVCLWPATNKQDDVIGKYGWVIGFGLIDEQNLPEVLQEAKVSVVDLITCFKRNGGYLGRLISDKALCAGELNGVGPCNGDSGGGLFFNGPNGEWYIRATVSIGITKINSSICDTEQYGLYVDVAKYIAWIRSNIQPDTIVSTASTGGSLVNREGCGFQSSLYTAAQGGNQKVGYPWVARLEGTLADKDCYGFLITESHLLTAATCVEDYHYRRPRLVVRLGNYHIPGLPAPQTRNIARVVIHPGFDTRRNNTNNIALLQMDERVDNTGLYVNWVCLNYFANFPNTLFTIFEANKEYAANFELFNAQQAPFNECLYSCDRKNIFLPGDGSYTCAIAAPRRYIYERPSLEGMPGALMATVSTRLVLLGLLPEFLPHVEERSVVQILKVEHYYDWIQRNL